MFNISRVLKGRKQIFIDKQEITRDNLPDIITKAMETHQTNQEEIEYLRNYYLGEQEIQKKVKETRVEINHKITVNRAWEIVSFKLGYIFDEPIQYVSRNKEKKVTEDILVLNDYMLDSNKSDTDTDLAENFFVSGTGYRMILPNKLWSKENDETPFDVYTLDPLSTFVVRYNDLKREVALGVTFVTDEDENITYYCYTRDKYFVYSEKDGLISEEVHYLGQVPIIEYINNNARMGVFEPVLSLLDAINDVQSGRLDDIEQHVNAFLSIFGAEVDEETYHKIQEWKMLILPEGTDARYISAQLNQTDIQKLIDDLYMTILTICGIPNRNGSSSTSDTGAAVNLRDGWQTAQSQAKTVEKAFRRSERNLLKIILRIIRDMGGIKLKLSDLDIKFARRYADNILTKSQALLQFLEAGINPTIAIATCNIWNDPTEVALQSAEYLEKWKPMSNEGLLQQDRQDTGEGEEPNPDDVQ